MIPSVLYKKLKRKPALEKTTSKLYGYTGKELAVKGSWALTCTYKGLQHRDIFHIVDTPRNSQPILGLQACLKLNLIKLVLSVNPQPSPMTKEQYSASTAASSLGLDRLKGKLPSAPNQMLYQSFTHHDAFPMHSRTSCVKHCKKWRT